MSPQKRVRSPDQQTTSTDDNILQQPWLSKQFYRFKHNYEHVFSSEFVIQSHKCLVFFRIFVLFYKVNYATFINVRSSVARYLCPES